MVRKVISPLLALSLLSLAASFNGCSCQAHMGGETQAKAPEPPPPPPPPPPPAPAPAPAPAPEPEKPKVSLKAVGKARLQGHKVEIPGELEFDVNKATIKDTPQSKEILGTLKDFMNTNKNVSKLRIEGHTDNSGVADKNKVLSQQRAESVAKWLTDQGVDKNRIQAVGFGQDKPVAPNDTPENKQKNRRTEFHVAEMDGKPVTAAESGPTGGDPHPQGGAPGTPASTPADKDKKAQAATPATPATPAKK